MGGGEENPNKFQRRILIQGKEKCSSLQKKGLSYIKLLLAKGCWVYCNTINRENWEGEDNFHNRG